MSVTMEFARSPRRRRGTAHPERAGFTIVELLTVIVIIGILAGMISTAAYYARIAAMQGAINNELNELSQAVEAYRVKMGEYPPDGTDPMLIKRHMLKVFHYTGEPPQVEPCKALVFWLGGVIDENGIPIGFSDSANPFDPVNKNRIAPFFDFDPQRIDGGRYFPRGFNASDNADTYVYFRAEKGSGYQGKQGCCGDKPTKPYLNANSKTGEWVNPDTFQIHSPGLDGVHGAGTEYPTGGDYEQADYDDQTNFSGGPLKNKMP